MRSEILTVTINDGLLTGLRSMVFIEDNSEKKKKKKPRNKFKEDTPMLDLA